VSRPHLKRRFLFLLIAAAVFSLLLYGVYASEEALSRFFMAHMGPFSTRENFETVSTIIKLILCMGLAVVFVRALNEAIFSLNFRFRKKPQAPGLVRNIFSIIAYVLLFVILFKGYYPHVELGAVFTTSAIFGVILGLALQDTLGNLFAGLSLQADNPFQVGDVIVVGQNKWTGVVEGISWRAVKVRTFSNHVLILSNSSIAKEAIEVCPKDNLNARIVFFSTLYTDSPARTIHVVREAVREADNVSQMIRPNVRIRNMGDSGVEYEVKYWLEDYAKYNDTDALVRQRIWYAFRRARLNFAFPTRTLHLERKTKADTAQTDGSGFIERLSAVDIFAPLSMEQMAQLAASSASHIFAPGEIVIRAGDEGSSMFVVHNGRVSVQISDNGKPRTVALLNEGDFFGEMALFTGEPRTANVLALEETEVLEIGYQAMKHLFDTNPDLVDSLSHIIAERRVGLTAKPENAEDGEEESEGIIASIKRFFGFD
jgi:small-conductance mechanosensitive channel/CRP-like cAMP-binding protein